MKRLKYSSQTIFLFGVGVLLTLVLATSPAFARGIRATLAPSNSQPAKGEQITIAVYVDMTDVPDALGSYTARLRWNPQALKFVHYTGGATEGFTNPVVNQNETAQGNLNFAQAYPPGGRGNINILNLTVEVIGTDVSNSDLRIEFSTMAAAHTFENLLPKLENVLTGVKDGIKVAELPKTYALLPNLPNPFTTYTEIQYILPAKNQVALSVFNLLGQKVKTLINGSVEAGKQVIRWDGTDERGQSVPAGIYLYRLEVNGFVDEKKMILVR